MRAATDRRSSGIGAAIRALVAADGTAGVRHAMALDRAGVPLRDLSDAIHLLCVVHGAFPGVVDHAQDHAADAPLRDWLFDAAARAADERALLARLTAAIGPLPSTPGQAASEAAVSGQRHALEMLARSDRDGCAAGTAFAFVLDWAAVRRVLDRAAARLGLEATGDFAVFAVATQTLLDRLDVSARVERAMTFGAQQMLAQHRGLWQLLEARAAARDSLGA
jgi:hypothetical protein